MHRFANPGRFIRIANLLLPWCVGLTAILLAVGLYLAFFVAPPDYQQGESVRIMYVHVPSAWMALFVYTVIAAASAVALIWRHPLADLVAKASAPIGAGFTFLALPLNVPVLIFGVCAIDAALAGFGARPHLLFLGALFLVALVTAPLAGAAALRQALE